ncbi:MAG: phosphoadenylyl-sulfate reductase, partial [Thermoleophilaceae bacterium]|nr:phosphoadenylyl-sulfate reductase [Thermoleophilaceae bacterium]
MPAELKIATTPTPVLDAPAIDLEAASAQEVLSYAVDQFHPRMYVACSFQKEASVILDMLLKIQPSARFFTIDTGALFPETFEIWRQIEDRYKVKIDVYSAADFATPELLQLGTEDNLWAGATDACCSEYKVQALQQALSGVDAWVTGLRREQAHTRAQTRKVQWDQKNDRWKVCPIADWSEQQVWDYIAKNDVPYHPLHDQGYSSIGCVPCTQPGSGRDGRWAESEKTECG